VVAEKQEPAAVTLDGGSTEQLSKRLSALEEQATATLRDQVLMCHLLSQLSPQGQTVFLAYCQLYQ
jgi:hypothetical protein